MNPFLLKSWKELLCYNYGIAPIKGDAFNECLSRRDSDIYKVNSKLVKGARRKEEETLVGSGIMFRFE